MIDCSKKASQLLYSIFLLLMFSFAVMAQDKSLVKHTVAKGETISQIATKYKITPYDIYQLNPDSQRGVKEHDVLLIPTSAPKPKQSPATIPKAPATSISAKTHIAKAGETLYSIARDYKISIDDLKKSNPDLFKEGLKVGQTIKIPAASGKEMAEMVQELKHKPVIKKVEPKAVAAVSGKAVYHIVEPKETKYGIAKKYGISVTELEQRNPSIVGNFPIGTRLIISGSAEPSPSKTEAAKPKAATQEIVGVKVVQTQTTNKILKNGFANYEVKPSETIYSLTKLFDLTEDELMILNPTLKEGLKAGMILKVPGKGSITQVAASTAKFADLSKTINTKDKKTLVLLIPFNANKIQADTLKTVGERLKKDAFLNMTLDFYSGALVAIDSAKTLGLNIDVKIYDSEESKQSSNVVNIVKDNNLQNVDAIIGPFYQQYVEKVAELVNAHNVPVISPLSREMGRTFSNLYQTMPPSELAKKAMFNYMMAKDGNIIVVSDPKKLSNKEFISANYPDAKIVTVDDKGALDVEKLKSDLVVNKTNYVIIDSEKTGLILATTNVLLNQMAGFKIQLAIIESNDTLDFEEISMKRLTVLKMLSPSLTRDNTSPEALIFEEQYKKANKIFPSQYATRGFDVTFDTMLRLSQGKSFEACANEDLTEQVENRFEYARNIPEGFINKGIYIMEYQEDLSVKQVN